MKSAHKHKHKIPGSNRAEKEKQRAIDSAAFMKTLKPSKWVPR